MQVEIPYSFAIVFLKFMELFSTSRISSASLVSVFGCFCFFVFFFLCDKNEFENVSGLPNLLFRRLSLLPLTSPLSFQHRQNQSAGGKGKYTAFTLTHIALIFPSSLPPNSSAPLMGTQYRKRVRRGWCFPPTPFSPKRKLKSGRGDRKQQ